MPAGAAALCFYASVAAGSGAAVLAARRAVERRPAPPAALWLAAFAVAGFAVSVVAYVTGPRDVLPF